MDISYGIVKIELSELIETAITAVANEKQTLIRLKNELENAFYLKPYEKYDCIRAIMTAKNIEKCGKRLVQSIDTLYHLIEAETREVIEIVRDEKKIDQFID